MPGRSPHHHQQQFPPDRTASLEDSQLRELLVDLRARSDACFHDDPAAIEFAIAELECEAARRRVALDDDAVPERTPPALALRLFERAFAGGDTSTMERMLPRLDLRGLWIAQRRVRKSSDALLRRSCFEGILFLLDGIAFGYAQAKERLARVRELDLPAADQEACLEQCITAVFNLLMAGGPADPE